MHCCQGHLFPGSHRRPKPITEQPSLRPRWPNTIRFKQLRQPVTKAIIDAKAQTTSQAAMFQKEHYNYLQSLEEQALGEESRSHHDILSSCEATLHHSSQSIRGVMAVSYHLLLGQTPQLPSLIQPPRTPPVEEQTFSATPPTPMPKQSLRPKRCYPSPEPMGNKTPW